MAGNNRSAVALTATFDHCGFRRFRERDTAGGQSLVVRRQKEVAPCHDPTRLPPCARFLKPRRGGRWRPRRILPGCGKRPSAARTRGCGRAEGVGASIRVEPADGPLRRGGPAGMGALRHAVSVSAGSHPATCRRAADGRRPAFVSTRAPFSSQPSPPRTCRRTSSTRSSALRIAASTSTARSISTRSCARSSRMYDAGNVVAAAAPSPSNSSKSCFSARNALIDASFRKRRWRSGSTVI